MANLTIPCASLHVNDLHGDVTEAILYEKFEVYGTVLSIRVCRDRNTRKSLGYAYVNYRTNAEARKAMDNLNYKDIHGRPCRITWSERDPATRRSGGGNIFIKNLDVSLTSQGINDIFGLYGEITSCKVQCDEKGASKGFAYVNFALKEDAEKAIQAIDGKKIRSKIVFVGKFVPHNQRTAANKEFTSCAVKNLPNDVEEAELREMFGQYGDVVSAVVMRDEGGVSLGYGFVTFLEHDHAVRAVDALNNTGLRGNTIKVGQASTIDEEQRERNEKYEKLRQERLQQQQSGVSLDSVNVDMKDKWKLTMEAHMKNKQLLCETIYPLVSKHAGHRTEKIMELFLELSNIELLNMKENEDVLKSKIEDAMIEEGINENEIYEEAVMEEGMAVLNIHDSDGGAHLL